MSLRSAEISAAGLIAGIVRFGGDVRGATAIEYALIASAIFLGIVGSVSLLHERVNHIYGLILGFFT